MEIVGLSDRGAKRFLSGAVFRLSSIVVGMRIYIDGGTFSFCTTGPDRLIRWIQVVLVPRSATYCTLDEEENIVSVVVSLRKAVNKS